MAAPAFTFTNLAGATPLEWDQPLYFIGTGMRSEYNLSWMSTAPGRRDFGSGISGSQLAGARDTCFAELRLTVPYPNDSYCFSLTGKLRLLDLRCVEDPLFSGKYYADDRLESCQILEANRPYLDANGYDGILRHSQPLLKSATFSDVVAITPMAIGKLGVQDVEKLGPATRPLFIIWPDGTRTPV